MTSRPPGRPFPDDFLERLQRLRIIARRAAPRAAPGARRSLRMGDGLEFADHRDYAAGDDVRFIDWAYYARMEKLLLRLFHEHAAGDVCVMLDCSGSMAPGGETDKFDYARRVAAAIAYVATGGFDRVWIVPFAERLGRTIGAGTDRGDVLRLLDELAALECGGRTQLDACAAELTSRLRPAGTVLIVTDLLDCADRLGDALARLRYRRCDPTVVHVFAPADAEPPMRGPVALESAEGDERLLVRVDDELAGSYRRRWEAMCEGARRTCGAREATYVQAPTDLPFERLMLETLRRAGVIAE